MGSSGLAPPNTVLEALESAALGAGGVAFWTAGVGSAEGPVEPASAESQSLVSDPTLPEPGTPDPPGRYGLGTPLETGPTVTVPVSATRPPTLSARTMSARTDECSCR